ncbi:MAG: 1-acyl-sn-glycerol-3-phosphate acyltransferase [Capnocytophaga sp.]|nr:1-acyl-sn-glycerol-3-phosphate acyltransferase [Capnocytophaga sp.]
MYSEQFEAMRPYADDEVPKAVERILQQDIFAVILDYLYPQWTASALRQKMLSITSVDEFQHFFSGYAVQTLIRNTSDGFAHDGLQHLSKEQPYLFIANHRDIVLDSAIMQWLLQEHGFPTSQITFGSNLMSAPWIVDLGKLNKMFTFYRSGSKMDAYRHALLHSAYIRNVLTVQKESVWIAQRDGRTKDGNDRTQPALLKMLLSKKENRITSLRELNIVPVITSYEHEPCDLLKAKELYARQQPGSLYTKTPDEDFNSVVHGLLDAKGRITMRFGTPINQWLDANPSVSELKYDTFILALCNEIDRQMYTHYELYPYHYTAYDLQHKSNRFSGNLYQKEDVSRFREFLHGKTSEPALLHLLTSMYANPVTNRLRAAEENRDVV